MGNAALSAVVASSWPARYVVMERKFKRKYARDEDSGFLGMFNDPDFCGRDGRNETSQRHSHIRSRCNLERISNRLTTSSGQANIRGTCTYRID